VSFALGCMSARVLAFVFLAGLCGCTTPPAGAPTAFESGFRRENHPAFTTKEQAMVTAARRYLEQRRGKKMDAYYRVTRTEGGYSVFVCEVYRYVRKQPRYTQNRDWAVDFTDDGTIVSVWHCGE
jgi:hypothetical protein